MSEERIRGQMNDIADVLIASTVFDIGITRGIDIDHEAPLDGVVHRKLNGSMTILITVDGGAHGDGMSISTPFFEGVWALFDRYALVFSGAFVLGLLFRGL